MNTDQNNHTRQADGFGCQHYQPLPNEKRCQDYLHGGYCNRGDGFRCSEWLKLNGRPKSSFEQRGPVDLFGNPIPAPSKPVENTPRPTAAAPMSTPDHPKPLRGLTTEDIEGFKALKAEVCFSSEAYGEIWLVPEYTKLNRKELMPEHAATICHVLAAFPGSKLVSFEQPKKESN